MDVGFANHIDGTASATDTTETTVIAAQGTNTFLYITSITVANSSATNTTCAIKDGSSTVWVLPALARDGHSITFPVPLRLSANTALKFAAEGSVTTMYVSAAGYVGHV